MDQEETSRKEKCIKQLAQNVVRNVKFLSSHQKANLFIAEIVTQKEENTNSRFMDKYV